MPGQSFLSALSRFVMTDGTGRQTVVAEDVEVLRQDIGLRAARLLVIPSLALQETIEIFLAAFKSVEDVLASQLFYDAQVARSRARGLSGSANLAARSLR